MTPGPLMSSARGDETSMTMLLLRTTLSSTVRLQNEMNNSKGILPILLLDLQISFTTIDFIAIISLSRFPSESWTRKLTTLEHNQDNKVCSYRSSWCKIGDEPHSISHDGVTLHC